MLVQGYKDERQAYKNKVKANRAAGAIKAAATRRANKIAKAASLTQK